jgi:hypothetical protein
VPIFHFIALALADHAFMARGINSAEDIFRIEVPPHRNSLQLKWKPEKVKTQCSDLSLYYAYCPRVPKLPR